MAEYQTRDEEPSFENNPTVVIAAIVIIAVLIWWGVSVTRAPSERCADRPTAAAYNDCMETLRYEARESQYR